jgi:SH3-like domain-containing protein
VVSFPYGLNLRQEPSSASGLVAFLEAETVLILLDGHETNNEGSWQEVSLDDQTGWVLTEYLAKPES